MIGAMERGASAVDQRTKSQPASRHLYRIRRSLRRASTFFVRSCSPRGRSVPTHVLLLGYLQA